MTPLQRKREEAGLKLTELASRAQYDPTILSKIEHGKRRMSVDDVMRLARAIGCHPSDLLPDIEYETPAHV